MANNATIEKAFLQVNCVPTRVLKLGSLKEKSSLNNDTPRVLMLIIPGNPGVPEFYEDFMQELYSHCEGQVPVWALGHAGHCQPPEQSLTLSHITSNEESLYGLEAQIAHKVSFIQDHIPPDVSLILIGHSIGCYMILNCLDRLAPGRVLRSFMLFPTIERMAESPSGRVSTPVLQYLRWVIVFVSLLLSFIPASVKLALIHWHYKSRDCPSCCYDAVLKTISPWTTNFTTYLARLEMIKVKTLQKNLVKTHAQKLSFYYGACDHWTPVSYYKEFVSEFPYVDAKLCNLNFKHAFVLETKEGQAMAKLVWEWAQHHHHTVLSKSRQEPTWVFDE